MVGGDLVNLGWEAIPAWLRGRGRVFVEECLLLGRPLSIRVDFVWWIWGAVLLFEALLAAAFPAAVRGVGETLMHRPLASALMGLAGIPLVMLLGFTLGVTVVLAPAVLLIVPAVLLSVAMGEAACLRVLGAAMLRVTRESPFPAAVEFGLGAALMTGLFLVPFLGFMVWGAMDLWVFGAVLLSILRRESRGGTRRATGGVAEAEVAVAQAPEAAAAVLATETLVPAREAVGASPDATATTAARPRRWHDAETGPAMDAAAVEMAARPGLGRRAAALVIDWVPLLVIAGNLPDGWDGLFRVGGAIGYFATMVAWRGTTLGGLVAGLRVVRTDGRAMDRPTAVVRALAAMLSVLCLGLGWFWASWDPRRQTWHDRIAGTVVVRDDSGRGLV
jgi:uncharacterized RDD family membrane protein YckC